MLADIDAFMFIHRPAGTGTRRFSSHDVRFYYHVCVVVGGESGCVHRRSQLSNDLGASAGGIWSGPLASIAS